MKTRIAFYTLVIVVLAGLYLQGATYVAQEAPEQPTASSQEEAFRLCEGKGLGEHIRVERGFYLKPVFDPVLMQEVFKANPWLKQRAKIGSHTFRFPELREGEYFCIPKTAMLPGEVIDVKVRKTAYAPLPTTPNDKFEEKVRLVMYLFGTLLLVFVVLLGISAWRISSARKTQAPE